MSTEKSIEVLAAVGKDLSQLLGAVLLPSKCPRMNGREEPICSTCSTWVEVGIRKCIPNPIPLEDYNISMQYFREMGDEHAEELISAMVEIFLLEIDNDTDLVHAINNLKSSEVRANANSWFTHCAKPKHFLQATAVCSCRLKAVEI